MSSPYSMFPGGRPGLALLILRICAAAIPLIHDRPSGYLWLLLALGAALSAGFLTQIAAVLSVAIQLFAFNPSAGTPAWLCWSLLNAISVALIGPGAYSLDARLFGRRLLMSSRRR